MVVAARAPCGELGLAEAAALSPEEVLARPGSGQEGLSSGSCFRTGWFVESIAVQTLVVYVIRTRRIPFPTSRPGLPMLLVPTGATLAGAVLPYTGLARLLGFTPLPRRLRSQPKAANSHDPAHRVGLSGTEVPRSGLPAGLHGEQHVVRIPRGTVEQVVARILSRDLPLGLGHCPEGEAPRAARQLAGKGCGMAGA
jgi:hypothetical protein